MSVLTIENNTNYINSRYRIDGMDCIIVDLSETDNNGNKIHIKGFSPTTVNYTNGTSEFSSIGIAGRTSLAQFNNVKNRSLNLVYSIPANLLNASSQSAAYNLLENLKNSLEALNYPEYDSGIIEPKVFIQYGNEYTLKGVYKCLVTPMQQINSDNGKYTGYTFNITVTEYLNKTFSASQVRRGKLFYSV